MNTRTRSEPTSRRRALAFGTALALGTALTGIGSTVLGYSRALDELWGLGALVAVWICCPFVAIAVHDGILRRSGAVLPPPRTPRNLRAPIAWMLGYAAGAGPPVIGVFGYLLSKGDAPPEGWSTSVILAAVAFLIVAGPTLGVLVTRALCRLWAAPPAASPPVPAAPAPAPAPLPARPADDPPAMPFLPAPA